MLHQAKGLTSLIFDYSQCLAVICRSFLAIQGDILLKALLSGTMHLNAMIHFLKKTFAGFFLKLPLPNLPAGFVLLFLMGMSSCTPTKTSTYFADIPDATLVKLPDMARPELIIMPDDMLEIKIVGANEVTTQVFNTFGGLSTPGAAAGAPVYTVDRNGDIELPYVGKIKAAGLSKDQLKDKLKIEIAPYLKELMINIRFTNFRFTVLGEVRLPGSYIFPTDKVTVLEALGQAGDMTQYAVKENVRVIRDSSGRRAIGKVDFTQKDIFNSPFYYLQRNDVVYIETNKNKTKNEQFSRASSLVATFTSLIAIAITIFRK